MSSTPATPLKPRKQPRQARSTVTVDAIFEAGIQVLLEVGHARLTTTRVAERAGVSVGSLYQYYPNKWALLAALVERHLNGIVDAVAAACAASEGQTLETAVGAFTQAFVEAKMARVDVSLALYAPAAEVEGAAMVRAAIGRAQGHVANALARCSDYRFDDVFMPSLMLLTGAVGPVQALIEAGPTPASISKLRRHLEAMAMGYLERIGERR